MKKLGLLENDPFPSDVKRVLGMPEKIFRVRVGHYRIQYEVLMQEQIVVITSIEKRSRAY